VNSLCRPLSGSGVLRALVLVTMSLVRLYRGDSLISNSEPELSSIAFSQSSDDVANIFKVRTDSVREQMRPISYCTLTLRPAAGKHPRQPCPMYNALSQNNPIGK
jgi:hypothetical protein